MSDVPLNEVAPAAPADPAVTRDRTALWTKLLAAGVVVALLGVAGVGWRVASMQDALARQAAQANAAAAEALVLARQSQDIARETAARAALLEGRLAEVSVQRAQLEELMQSLSRSRDENLVVDIESALRLAQQQAVLTGGTEPLVAALQAGAQRIERAAQPRLANVLRALRRDIDRVKAVNFADTPAILQRLDELVRAVDELPLASGPPASLGESPARRAVGAVGAASASLPPPFAPWSSAWWQSWGERARDEALRLVRVSRIAVPEAALLSPEQSFFLRENLKLKLLNARMAVLARQFDGARTDLATAQSAMARYFEPGARRTTQAQGQLAQLQQQLRQVELPRIDDTLAALAAVAGAR